MQEGLGGPCSRACSGKAISILEEQKGWSHRSEKEGGKWKEKSLERFKEPDHVGSIRP